MSSLDGNETARKIALCGALMAGIAYFGVTILRDAFASHSNRRNKTKKSSKKRHNSESMADELKLSSLGSGISDVSSQTELTLPIGTRDKLSAFRDIPPELWSPWAKSINDRIRELNLRMVNSANFAFRSRNRGLHLNNSISLQNTPKHSPRSLQSPDCIPIPKSRNCHSALSRSTEHIDQNLSPSSLKSSRSAIGLKRTINLCMPSETEILINKRVVDKLFGKSNPNISQHEAYSLTILLMCADEDLLVKSLSVIANCAAFTANIDTICDSGAVLLLYELLDHSSKCVQIAATNAISNIAFSERAQELFKDCIPSLVTKLNTCDNELQLNYTLVALANLAIKDSNQIEMISALHRFMNLLSHSNPNVRLQDIKLLVNLSTNSEIVPYLLAAKAPKNLFNLLESNNDIEILVRVTNFLANVIETTCLRGIKAHDLPFQYKAAAPETLYSALFGYDSREILMEKLNDLSNIEHNDVSFQVNRILKKLTNFNL